MKINLKQDRQAIVKHLKQRIRDYPVYVNQGPGADEDPITQITLGYSVAQAGWIALVFDTRPGAEPDGEWNSYIEENMLEFPQWSEAVDALWDNDEPIQLTLPDGSKQNLGEDEGEPVEQIGSMLKDILLQAREENLFAGLPIARKNLMGVEDTEGAYGWPDYDNRFKQGWIIK